MLCALIMAGGKGTRFWPLSTEEKPKQFLNLINEETMIQMTVNRVKDIIPMERIFVCTGKQYVSLVKEQLAQIQDKNIIIEPEGRNTAPCVALSTLVINRYYKNSNIVVLPADHLISDEEKFRTIINDANEYLNENNRTIITLGMKPSRAETGYGYIKYGKKEVDSNTSKIIDVERFVEKPNKQLAKQYVEDGTYLWNGGMFVWNSTHILKEIRRYMADTYEAISQIDSIEEKNLQLYIDGNYNKTEAISIDYAILEKTDSIVVIPSDIGWDDVGNWRAIERYREKDRNNNISFENVKFIDSKSTITMNNKKEIVMIGMKDIMAVETDEQIFIVNKEYLDKLNTFKERI